MKMKKIGLLFSMIAVFFSLTACSSGRDEVTFEYNSTDIIQNTLTQAYQLEYVNDAYRAYLADSDAPMAEVLLTGISNFDSAREECGQFTGYRSTEGNNIYFDLMKLEAEDEESYNDALAEFYDFISLIDADIEESGSDVIVTLRAVYEKGDVIYSFVYEENPAAAYSYALTGQSVAPFQVKEITATPDYSFSEKMARAASNTLMGMGTVFVVLIFISLIIGSFGKINEISVKIANRQSSHEGGEEKPVQSGQVPAGPTGAPASVQAVNPMEDTQLVAVITAAVAAASAASGGSDKLVVRSIRKAKR